MRFYLFLKFAMFLVCLYIFLLILPFSQSISLKRHSQLRNFTPIRILSDYDYPQPNSSDREYIVIVATNDFHGNLLPITESYSMNKTLRVSGLTLLSSYLDALAEEWKENLMWLDAGDEFQGSIESNSFGGEPIIKFMNSKSEIFKVAALGNHDFDFGFGNLSQRLTESNFEHLAANINNIYNDKTVIFPNTLPSEIHEVGSLKVGIIGLTTMETPFTTAADVSGLIFKDYAECTIRESKKLREKGADVVILLSHVGVRCNQGNIFKLRELGITTRASVDPTNCTSNGELFGLLEILPEGTIDAVVGGHTHEIVHHFINDTPVVIGENMAKYLNLIYLPWDKKEKKLIKEDIIIEGPVPICERIPENERTCYTKFMKNKANENITLDKFSFHGKIIEEDQFLLQDLKGYIQKGEEYRKSILATIMNPLARSKEEESALGDYICDTLKEYTKSDIAIYNNGGIRMSWEKGKLTYYQLYQTFPFENLVTTFEITGEELIKMITILQNGKKGFYHTSGLRQEVCSTPHLLKNVSLLHEKPINNTQMYKIVSNDFLVEGGDDFNDVLKIMTFKNIGKWANVRDVIGEDLKRKNEVNTEQMPCLDSLNPRLIISRNC